MTDQPATDLDQALMAFCSLKDKKLADLGPDATIPGDDDLLPMLHFYRGGTPIAVVSIIGGRDEALGVARLAITTLEVDSVILLLDAHMRYVSPDELEDYEPGSMQQQCHEEGACETGAITDCLMAYRATKGQAMEGRVRPYRLHAAERRAEWSELVPMGGVYLTGLIPDAIAEFYAAPTLFEHSKALGVEPPPNARQVVDKNTFDLIAEAGHICLVDPALLGEARPQAHQPMNRAERRRAARQR